MWRGENHRRSLNQIWKFTISKNEWYKWFFFPSSCPSMRYNRFGENTRVTSLSNKTLTTNKSPFQTVGVLHRHGGIAEKRLWRLSSCTKRSHKKTLVSPFFSPIQVHPTWENPTNLSSHVQLGLSFYFFIVHVGLLLWSSTRTRTPLSLLISHERGGTSGDEPYGNAQ